MRNRTFPKENQKKLNQTIKELRDELKTKDKEIRFLREEIDNLMKPVRTRKVQVEMSEEEKRQDFIRRFKKEVFGEKG